MRRLPLVIVAILLSTMAYYLSNLSIDVSMIKIIDQNKELYQFFCIKLAGAFFMTAFYCWLAFALTSFNQMIQKIGLFYLATMETITFVFHIIDKFIKKEVTNYNQIAITLIIFSIFCIYTGYRAIYRQKSDIFNPKNTYIVKLLPKNLPGLINYLLHGSGHQGIYQDGNLYKFSDKTKKVEIIQLNTNLLSKKDLIFKEIPRVNSFQTIIGKRYNLIKYNCNHLIKDAQRA